jgi:hypothetical protein
LKFEKRRQFFFRAHNETLSVIAVRVSNADCSSAKKQCNKLARG